MGQDIANSNLSLGAVGKAVGANSNAVSETALAADGRGANTTTSISDFFCGDVNHDFGYQGGSGQTGTLTLNYGTGYNLEAWIDPTPSTGDASGSLFFSRISTRPQNWPLFQCASNCSYYSIASSPDQLFNITTVASMGQSVTSYISVTFADGLNTGAWGYNIGQSQPINITTGVRSDIRLKENIQKLGTSPSGIPIYSFKYKGESTYYKGTMAQDLLNIGRQDAVTLMDDGYYGVYYDKLDISHKIFNGF